MSKLQQIQEHCRRVYRMMYDEQREFADEQLRALIIMFLSGVRCGAELSRDVGLLGTVQMMLTDLSEPDYDYSPWRWWASADPPIPTRDQINRN